MIGQCISNGSKCPTEWRSRSWPIRQIGAGKFQVYASRLPRYVSGYRIPHKMGDFIPYIGNDVRVLEGAGKRIVICVFTANHFGAGDRLEDAIGRIAELTGNYFGAK
jgi:hypothetical protein